ncbi:septal ring lytic transglycosylase RlpA family protein [Luteolibacter algae]|uniref:Probable endolytic peptidoglycan transglycosylase RlpA n=1 Tax=Luteolibacter algae TaxID=454151 RepID=A0ABW5D350_9BACT
MIGVDRGNGSLRLPTMAVLLMMVLTGVSCSSRPGGYSGYMTRSYTVRGQTYHPLSVDEALGYTETGECSWYDESSFFGLKRGNTSLGEKVQRWHLTGAHKTLPLPALVKVTNLENGKSLKIRINDRGPFIAGRHLDLTPRAAKKLGFYEDGLTRTRLEVLSIGDGKYERKSRRGFLFW